jgi:hypothetical protein
VPRALRARRDNSSSEIAVALQVVYRGQVLPAADALVEHEVTSGERLHLLLPVRRRLRLFWRPC